jgi:hypothetical protein
VTVTRAALLLFAFAGLAAWAGAQGPPPLPAATQVKLFKTNRALIESLVNHGLDIAAKDDPQDRAEECRKTARTLVNYLARAAQDDQDADRVAELAGLLTEVVRDGLAPNWERARREIPPGSPREPELLRTRDAATSDLDAARNAVPAGKVADHPKVRQALNRLTELKTAFGP